MQHIKSIKEYDDLEDCLQEVFDKFSITKSDSVGEGNDKFLINGTLFYTFHEKFSWDDEKFSWDKSSGHNQLIIGREGDWDHEWGSKKVMPEVKKEIERIKSMVEKRVGSRIEVGYCTNKDFLYVEVLKKKKWWQLK